MTDLTPEQAADWHMTRWDLHNRKFSAADNAADRNFHAHAIVAHRMAAEALRDLGGSLNRRIAAAERRSYRQALADVEKGLLSLPEDRRPTANFSLNCDCGCSRDAYGAWAECDYHRGVSDDQAQTTNGD